jgi:hypothetical protein
VNCNKFPKICLKEFRHASQQRADSLNICYDGEYNVNYYIWLTINKISKQCVLAVLTAWLHFSQQVARRFSKKLRMVKTMFNQPALWTPCTYRISLLDKCRIKSVWSGTSTYPVYLALAAMDKNLYEMRFLNNSYCWFSLSCYKWVILLWQSLLIPNASQELTILHSVGW